jgi:putative colanic acid biosynthesis acetyltransferase WcaF
MTKKVDLNSYNNTWYKPGNKLKIVAWYWVNELVLKNTLFPFSKLKVIVLRFFGAKIGKGITIKPGVNIKYPWLLEIGNHCWIGEGVWIDNLDQVSIGNHVCISQDAMLLCGNHNFKTPTFDLIIKPIILEDGTWVGAKSLVCPGVTLKTHSILTVGSVANKDLDAYSIYKGNPALKIKSRKIE